MIVSRVLDVTSHSSFDAHEQVVLFKDPELRLQAIIAVHNTHLGPSLGGCRMYPYASFDAAVTDVLRLSRGMTYKSALAGLPLGGGKAVIIGDPKTAKSPAFMERFGEAVDSLKGTYITAEDVGSTEEDMVSISHKTSFVAGLPHQGVMIDSVAGNPSPVTAYGVYCGIKASVRHVFGQDDLAGRRVAIQGVGAVGSALAKYLAQDGAKLVVADIHPEAIARLQADLGESSIDVDDVTTIHAADVDVFAPCALGAGLNDQTIPQIQAKIVAGAANNQLAEARHDRALKDAGILYAPDYAINSGGITSVGYEYFDRTGRNPYDYHLTRDRMMAHVAKIGATLESIYALSESKDCGTGEAANSLAEQFFKA